MSLKEAGAVALLRKIVEEHRSGNGEGVGRFIGQAELLLANAPAALEPTPESISRAWVNFCKSGTGRNNFAIAAQEIASDLAVASASSEREKLLAARIEQLEEACEPGKASGIVAGLFRHAEAFGHSPVSSKHGLTYLVEEVARLRALHAGTALKNLPFYAEWDHQQQHGEWRNGVPDFARDREGAASEVAAMRCVIAELVAALGVGLSKEREAQLAPYTVARGKLPDACFEDAHFARMFEDHPEHMAKAAVARMLWLSKAVDALVPEVTHAVAWQARTFHANDPDEDGNCWGLWHPVAASDLKVHVRRAIDNPERYQVRPLFTQPADWCSRMYARGADQPARALEDMTGWQPWRIAFEVYWASMACAPGTDPSLLYNMKNASLDAWRVQEEKYAEPSCIYVGLDDDGVVLSVHKRSDYVEATKGVQRMVFWDLTLDRAFAQSEAPGWDVMSLLPPAA